MSASPRRSARPLATLLLLGSLVAAPGCGGSDDDREVFVVRNTKGTVSAAIEPVVEGHWIVYWVSEALVGATELARVRNADADATDEVAVAIRTDVAREYPLQAAAVGAAILGAQVYLAVDEAADGVDWNGTNGMNDRVLLHWSQGAGALTLVATLSPNAGAVPFVTFGRRIYFAAVPAMALTGDQTALHYVSQSDPTTAVLLEAQAGTGTLDPVLLGEEEGLVFVLGDETRELRDLNGDLDFADPYVLFLLDGTEPDTRLVPVGLALEDLAAPFSARAVPGEDWNVAFLVDEGDQGGQNLNAPGLVGPVVPAPCAGTPDADALDQVLHHLAFRALEAGMGGIVNTGLAGRDRVVLVEEGVATLSDEADAMCDLNQDMDLLDTVARWVPLAMGSMPGIDPTDLHALNTTLPGGAMGLARLGERLVAAVSEAQDSRDLDGKPVDHDLVAWLEPEDGAGAGWTFAHQHPSQASIGTGVFEDVDGDGLGDPYVGASEPYAGTTWMGERNDWGRLAVTFEERVPGMNLNNNLRCGLYFKDNDATDVLPVWLSVRSGVLDFDGIGYSVDPSNAGLVVAGAHAFFRVSEVADNLDHNRDGVLDDLILVRNPIGICGPFLMADASSVPGPVIFSEGDLAAAFFSDETARGVDYNGDGDALDLVLRYFLL